MIRKQECVNWREDDVGIPGFGLALVKREGDIDDPRTYDWECDLDTCQRCRRKFDKWLKAYEAQEANRSVGT